VKSVSLAAFLSLFCLGTAAAAEADSFWHVYERYPHMQDFFPFGIYGGATGNWSQFGHDPRGMNDMVLDIMAENGLNTLWETAFHRHMRRFERDGKPTAELSDYGRWWYDEALPAYGFKTMPSLINVFTRQAFADYQRHDPPLSTAERDKVAAAWRGVLDPIAALTREYPETIFGFVSDDEPDHLAAMVAADKVISGATGRPVTTCIPSWGQSKVFLQHMQPFTGDWYVTTDNARNNWAITRNLKWMQENAPDRIFWFLPLASSYSHHEPTKPWLLDARPQPVDLRMQFWMALAGGCKGFFYYNLLYGIQWAKGEDNLLSVAHVANNDLWPELGRLAPMITTAGPLLLSCRPDVDYDIRTNCGRVRYAEYDGPAVSVGLLRDIRRDRFVLVPYSNDLHERQRAVLALPLALAERQALDLATLESVPLSDGQLEVELGPGHGRLVMLAARDELAQAKAVVLRHRSNRARRLAKIALRRLRPNNADKLEATALAAKRAGNWIEAAAGWNALAAAAEKEFESGRTRKLAAARPVLDEIARILTETDDLLRCFRGPLELKQGTSMIWGVRGHGTKHAGKETGDFLAYLNMYRSLRLRYRTGQNMTSSVHNTALTLRGLARANQDAVRQLIDKRLTELRHPLTVACITGDRRIIEYHASISWLYESFRIRWFAPNAAGSLVDRNDKAFVPEEFDAVWIYQLRYVEAPADGRPVDPARVLLPSLLASDTVSAMRAYLNTGGGVVLQGVAGLYALTLGFEKELPDRLQENAWYDRAFATGVSAGPGCEKHPVFTGLEANGFLANGTYPGTNLVVECAWQKRRPAGTIVAVEQDEMFGAIPDYAAVVEYPVGKGRVLVLGGRSLDLTPAGLKNSHFSKNRTLNRRFLENAIVYVAGDRSFTPAEVQAPVAAASERHILPQTEWHFRLDPDNTGLDRKWFAPDLDTADWKSIRTGLNWEAQGYDYNGLAWYRRTVKLGNRPGKRTMLHFGAVDEQTVVWIDGKEAGRHEEGPSAWDKPFSFDITELLGTQDAAYMIAIQVHDSMAAGGIWKPVWIAWE
jgi:hypothetical protein